MCISTSPDFPISLDIMQKYVTDPATLKTIMCMLLDELDRGANQCTQMLWRQESGFKWMSMQSTQTPSRTTDLGINMLLFIIMGMLSSWTSMVV